MLQSDPGRAVPQKLKLIPELAFGKLKTYPFPKKSQYYPDDDHLNTFRELSRIFWVGTIYYCKSLKNNREVSVCFFNAKD